MLKVVFTGLSCLFLDKETINSFQKETIQKCKTEHLHFYKCSVLFAKISKFQKNSYAYIYFACKVHLQHEKITD